MDGNYSLSDIAAVTDGNRNNGMFGGDWSAWIILFLLFGLFGNNGWGGFGNGAGGGSGFQGYATRADINEGFALNGLQTGITAIQQGLCDSTYALSGAIKDCCCQTQRSIDGVNFNIAKGLCDLNNAMNTNTRDLLENQNSNTRAILDFLTQDKIATLTAENQSLKFQASQTAQNAFISANQEAQTATLLRRLGADCPTPAYVVQPPTPVHFPYNGCGCGCGNGAYGFAG
jgi:ferredoxin-like protein FixX